MTSSELLQKSTVENNDLYKTESAVENNLDDNLSIAFFDQVIGPRLFYCSNSECFEDFDLFSFLDVLEPGTFIFAFKKFHTINHIFTIDSEHARGFKEIIMLTYMIRNIDIEDTYRYLKSKTLVLEALAKDIKELKEFKIILSRKNKPENILELGSEEFRNDFLDIYERYCNILSSKFRILNPVNELKPQDIDTYTMKIHIKPAELSHILNAFLFNRKVAFWVRKKTKLKQKILDFFKFLFQDSFKIDITVKSKKFFNKNKNLVVWWEKKIYNVNRLKYLIELVKKFYAEPDSISAVINLRDKIRETYVLTNKIYEIANVLEKPIYLHRKPLIRQLEDIFYVKLKRNQIFYLREIVKTYFGLDIRWHQEQVAEKIEQTWGS